MRFADVFFDGLIVDWMAQRGIEQSLDSVAQTSAEVEQALMRLRNMDSSEREQLQRLEDDLHRIVMEG
jgi:ketol-acid reductoisomerase